jgi:hypothetical protein
LSSPELELSPASHVFHIGQHSRKMKKLIRLGFQRREKPESGFHKYDATQRRRLTRGDGELNGSSHDRDIFERDRIAALNVNDLPWEDPASFDTHNGL